MIEHCPICDQVLISDIQHGSRLRTLACHIDRVHMDPTRQDPSWRCLCGIGFDTPDEAAEHLESVDLKHHLEQGAIRMALSEL